MKKRLESFLDTGPLPITLVYLCFGFVYIYFSDNAVAIIANGNNETYLFLSISKGFGFIVVTSILLYFIVDYYIDRKNRV